MMYLYNYCTEFMFLVVTVNKTLLSTILSLKLKKISLVLFFQITNENDSSNTDALPEKEISRRTKMLSDIYGVSQDWPFMLVFTG